MCSVPRPFLPLSRADCSGTGIQRPVRVIGRERISAGFIHRDRLTVHRHVVSVVVSDREFSIAVVGSAVFNPRNRAGRRIVHGERKHAGQNLRALDAVVAGKRLGIADRGEHVLVRRPLVNVADHVIILLRNVVASVADVIAPEDVNGWNALAEGELFGAVCAGCACDGSMVGAAPKVLQIDRVIRSLRPPIRECAVGVVPIPLGLRFCHIRRHAQQERDPFLYAGSVCMFCSRHFFTARRSRRVFLSIMHDFLKEKRSRSKFRLPRIVVHSICSHM